MRWSGSSLGIGGRHVQRRQVDHRQPVGIDGFTAAFNDVWGIIKGFLNDIIGAIDLIPGVNIHKIGSSAPGTPAGAKAVGNLQAAGFATLADDGQPSPATSPGRKRRSTPRSSSPPTPPTGTATSGCGRRPGTCSASPASRSAGSSAPPSTPSPASWSTHRRSLASSAAQSITGLLPTPPAAAPSSLPSWIAGLPGEMLSKAAGFIKSKVYQPVLPRRHPPGGWHRPRRPRWSQPVRWAAGRELDRPRASSTPR